MKRINRYLIVILLLIPGLIGAHDYKVPLIIDTDMGIDDIRALLMLFNQNMADIRLMVTSDGCTAPREGIQRARILAELLNRPSPPMAAGRVLSGKVAPPWRAFNQRLYPFNRSRKSADPDRLNASRKIIFLLARENQKVVYLCLGPLTNLAEAIHDAPEIKQKISRVIYYGSHPQSRDPGWNTKRDVVSARRVFDSQLPLYCLQLPRGTLILDKALIAQVSALSTPAARIYQTLHDQPEVIKRINQSHFGIWDELCVIYMSDPSLFSFKPVKPHIHELSHYHTGRVKALYLKMFEPALDFHVHKRPTVVLNQFPRLPGSFQKDLADYVVSIINAHGLEEWKACVLTNEFHRHLGIYSIIGAKMGIRAREILQAPLDALRVISFAGQKPPLSCLNDGLQVSTGASLGRGTITLRVGSESLAGAEFKTRERSIVLRLKKKYLEQIRRDIQSAIQTFGNLTKAYFARIRHLSIRYWLQFSRQDLFELEQK